MYPFGTPNMVAARWFTMFFAMGDSFPIYWLHR